MVVNVLQAATQIKATLSFVPR
nr:hypothetical protein [Schlegelella koreensis]